MIYSFDTKDFYNKEEKDISGGMSLLRQLITFQESRKEFYEMSREDQFKFLDNLEKEINKSIKNGYKPKKHIYDYYIDKYEYEEILRSLKYCKKMREVLKKQFKQKLSSNTSTRVLRDDAVKDSNLISVFDSVLTRTIGLNQKEISKDIIIVETKYFEVLDSLIGNGFMYQDKKYICYTASAGQIRTKKTVFIREDLYKQHQNSLMCGLLWEDINKRKGINVNKYLAYLALSNSATDEWKDFNIDKVIVVDDFESLVNCEVDYIDHETFEIERKFMDVPIEHTDGCGMMLPKVSRKAFMLRAPWMKGLIVPFPFDKFVREKNKEVGSGRYGKVKDIYGKEYHLLKDGIEIVLTKSQFKNWKYYDSWDDYKEKFKKHNCQVGICNIEDDHPKKAKLNYQMLQTLTDMTEEELTSISKKTIDKIKAIGSDKDTMLEVLGVTEHNANKNSYQKALEIYPELLKDVHSKETLKKVKKSIVQKAKGGKLHIDGKYTFIAPDLYAFCEYLILGDKNPKGLLRNGEVYCSLYGDGTKLDCLRSPHLYREHAIRINKIEKEMKRWFITKSAYTSCHDPISKLLQFDVDGDKSLVCRDELVVEIAERNMDGIVPLYYEMKKAEPELLNSRTIYKGLEAAYKNGNIGKTSNNISKVWNSDKVDLDMIKILVCENNFVIDYAKTLYMPKIPKEIDKTKKKITKQKLPHFFKYAKDKEVDKVQFKNGSIVNMLDHVIPNTRLNFGSTGLGNFNYKVLMSGKIHKDNTLRDDIVKVYTERDLKKYKMDFDQANADWTGDNLPIYQIIRNEIISVGLDVEYIVDVLIEFLYEHKKSSYKTTLWSCFGTEILDNIKNNIKDKSLQCERCGERTEVRGGSKGNNTKYCVACSDIIIREKKREWAANNRNKNT
ncbi:RNA dependent RNA polymerase [Paenibacillus xylanexedens]|uniref:RNA dependent RNA polymerase n=1 Tax=Paenibacillus xylanexedens TaxID=528191 RepID=UPI000F90A7BB|nr:hypothetical protein [Paenibacillus xylanexedens]RPK23991.1 hypothetical protein EDO6_04929 [Paenibacillus xylanexedens]